MPQLKSLAEARRELKHIADEASRLGYQVTFESREDEHSHFVGIRISTNTTKES